MTVYIVNIILLVIFGLLFLGYKPNLNKKKFFCAIATTQWILISGLRHISVGADTLTYKINFFEIVKNIEFSELFNRVIETYFYGGEWRDPGYAVFQKLIQCMNTDYQFFLLIIACLFMIPLGVMIYKYSKNPFISFLIYSVLFYSFFAITGHRQTIATAIALLMGYPFLRDRKIWQFLLLVLIASTIHKSVLVLIPFYFLANKKITIKYLIMVSFLFIFVFIFKNQLMQIFGSLLGYEQYVQQFGGAGTPTFTLLYIVIFSIATWKQVQIFKNEENRNVTIWYNALCLGLLFIPLTYVDPNAMRVVQYFSIFIIFLIPEIIKVFSSREQPIIYYTISSLMIVLLIKTNPQYLFFWQ